MAKYRNVTTDFSGGLVTDHILGRVDIERLQKSAKPFTNFFPSLQGPAIFRDGFKFSQLADANKTVSIPVTLSDGRAYRVVLSELQLTVYNSSGTQLTQVAAPYRLNELDDVRWATETDILYLVHGRHAPRTLTVDVQFQLARLLPSDYLTAPYDGLESSDGDTLFADAQYDLGDDSWSLNEVEFTSPPFLDVDVSDNVLALSNNQEYVRLESSYGAEFDWIVNAASPAEQLTWYVEYFVNDQWSVGRVLNSTVDANIPDPTTSVVYVDPVDSVVNINDSSAKLSVADRSASFVATNPNAAFYQFDGLEAGEVNVRADALVFSPNQVNSWIRVGGERISQNVIEPKDTKNRWYKIKEYKGVSTHPVDYFRGVDSDIETKYISGSVYKSYADDTFTVYSLNDPSSSQVATSKVSSTGNRVFGFDNSFAPHNGGSTFTADAETTIGNLSTAVEQDTLEVYTSADATPNNIPEIVQEPVAWSAGATADGNLISPVGRIDVFDNITDPDKKAQHTATLTSSTGSFTLEDVGRFIFMKLGENWLTVKIIGFTTSFQVTIDVRGTIPKSKLTGKIANEGVASSFRMGAWYTNNYPATVTEYEQRRVYGGSYESPNFVWMSKNGDQTDFRTAESDGDVLDTTGISYPLGNVNATIRWLGSAKALTIGTDNGIYKLSPNDFAAAVSPTNIRIELEDPEGGLKQATFVGSAVFFPDVSGGRLLEFVYDAQVQASNTNDVSKLVYPTFLNDPIIRIDYSHTPQPRIWCLTSKGFLYCLTHHKKEDFYAWSKIDTEGEVTDMCVLRKGFQDTGEDQLWVTIKHGSKYAYEVLTEAHRDEDSTDLKENAHFLDSYIRFPEDGVATAEDPIANSLDVSARYDEGDVVRIVSDGVDRGDFTVGAGGLIDVTNTLKTSYVLIGKPYVGFIGLTINTWATARGTSYGAEARVVSMRPYVYKSVGYSVGIDDKYEYVEFDRSTPEALMEEESTYLLKEDGTKILDGPDRKDKLYTGFGRELPVRGSLFGVDKVPTIKHDKPYPLTVVSLVVKTDFNNS